MIPRECKRLAEVDFPIAEVSKHSAREKSIRHGHPSTLHLWWARRPLAACRAMLMALLLPDPCDENCPVDFKDKARAMLPRLTGSVGPSDMELRQKLLKFIADFSNWDNSANQLYLEISRSLVKAAHPEETPLVVDPFAGGGSIPLEALRVGCDAFASDLNAVASLIQKVMLDDIPRYGQRLADELRIWGNKLKEKAEQELLKFYPKDQDGARPIAYIWARTVRCEAPNCGAEIPLVRSFWLCKKANQKIAIKYDIVKQKGKTAYLKFEIFKPLIDDDVQLGTVRLARATCPVCKKILSPERVRDQLREQKGGGNPVFDEKSKRIGGAMLLCVVTTKGSVPGRNYRLPNDKDYENVFIAKSYFNDLEKENLHTKNIYLPNEPISTPLEKGFKRGDPYYNFFPILNYGMTTFSDLFTNRQLYSLAYISKLVREIKTYDKFQNSVKQTLGIVASRCADYNSSFARWASSGEFVGNTFGRQALPPVWDFCETYPLSEESGGYPGALNWVLRVIEKQGNSISTIGQVSLEDACNSPLSDESTDIWFTDPPYYDAVPYSHLSDYFFVWLKRSLIDNEFIKKQLEENIVLTQKKKEIIDTVELIRGVRKVDAKLLGIPVKDKKDFEIGITKALKEGNRIAKNNAVACIVFAHKTTEGWEALLGGIISANWTITGSWPISTERPGRLRSQDSAALSSSVHLVCRPRPDDALIGDWSEVIRELPQKVGDWMERLQSEGIRGADLVFACIGPALELFSKYSKVETADGREVTLSEYLEKVWEVVGRTALEHVLGTAEALARNGMAGALEEDARLTALFLWTLQSTNSESVTADSEDDDDYVSDDDEETGKGGKTKGYSLVYDVVRRFAQPLGIELPAWDGRIIETKKGVVRLLSVSERAKQLFGGEATTRAAEWIEREPDGDIQQVLFPEHETGAPKVRGRKKGKVHIGEGAELSKERPATTLDRVHAAMLFQASGQANALRALIKAEQDRGSDFVRLANALSALYPMGSEEKRLLDAMLLAVPR